MKTPHGPGFGDSNFSGNWSEYTQTHGQTNTRSHYVLVYIILAVMVIGIIIQVTGTFYCNIHLFVPVVCPSCFSCREIMRYSNVYLWKAISGGDLCVIGESWCGGGGGGGGGDEGG